MTKAPNASLTTFLNVKSIRMNSAIKRSGRFVSALVVLSNISIVRRIGNRTSC